MQKFDHYQSQTCAEKYHIFLHIIRVLSVKKKFKCGLTAHADYPRIFFFLFLKMYKLISVFTGSSKMQGSHQETGSKKVKKVTFKKKKGSN